MSNRTRELVSKYKVHALLVVGAVVAVTALGSYTFETAEQSASTTGGVATEVTAVTNTVGEAVETTEPSGTITGTAETTGTAEAVE